MVTRRELLKKLSLSASFSFVAPGSFVASGFSRMTAASSMKYGYAAITWGNDVMQAIDDIAAVGFRGIQLRTGDGTLARWGDNPAALHELLAKRTLTLAALSSGNLVIDPAREQEQLATHVSHAKFVKDAGGLYLQVIDERPKGRAIVADDYRRLGRLLTELGKRTGDLGVPLVYHHHMNSLGEKPGEVAAVLDAADRRHVRLLFDVAHYQQAGGDPVRGLRQYKDWLQLIHLKDVRAAGGAGEAGGAGGAGRAGGYQFVELGQGRVDLPGVFAALRDIGYDGWAVVELDRVPEPGRTARECAEINKRYLVDVVHVSV
jgi:inosose dehydratase